MCICDAKHSARTYLDIVSLVIVTALSEQSMCHDVVNVQFVQNGIRILGPLGETTIELVKNAKEIPCSNLL